MSASSPLRRKRGGLGVTIIRFEAVMSRISVVCRRDVSKPVAMNRHVVLASGTVKVRANSPFSSVVSIGRNIARAISDGRYCPSASLVFCSPDSGAPESGAISSSESIQSSATASAFAAVFIDFIITERVIPTPPAVVTVSYRMPLPADSKNERP